MFSLEQIKEFEFTYTKNLDTILYWDRELMNQKNHDEWMKTVYQRSQAIRTVFLENQQQLKTFFSMLNEDMNDQIREALYDMALRLFKTDKYDDIVVIEKIADTLLPYYELTENHSHIIHLLNVKCVLITEYRYRQDLHTEKYFYNDVHGKLFSYYKKYKELNANERYIIVANFYNMICCLPTLLPHEINYALDIYDEFLNMIQQEEIIELDKEQEIIKLRIDSIQKGVWNIAEKLEYFDKAHLFHFYELLADAYTAEKASGREETPDNLKSAYYYTNAYLTEKGYLDTGIDWKICFDLLFEITNIHLKKLEEIKIEVIDEEFLMNSYYIYQESAIYIFKIYKHIKQYTDTSAIMNFIRRGTKLIEKLPKGSLPCLVYAVQAEWCENVLEILKDPEEQQDMINRIIVKGQVQTYIHSQMVYLLSRAILNHMITYKPELLLTLPHTKSVENIQKHREEFIQFIHKAAMYHDVGKSKISIIINQQTRALTDEEFGFIKQHPETDILKGQETFNQYFDIITGHHKSYDGKSGYPEYFDNVHSPYRILIDLITICDCIDAATDYLGRNYAGGKKFEEVMQELGAGKGTRYNPDIVDLILTDDALKESMTAIVKNGRDEVYYQTYREYFS